jgi:hypothetical protein
MSQHSHIIAVVLAAIAMVSFWRQLLLLLLALLMVVFCLGLYAVVEFMYHG